jgi:pilus assembly protein CpaF
MRLVDRLRHSGGSSGKESAAARPQTPAGGGGALSMSQEVQEIAASLHDHIVDRLDLGAVSKLPRGQLRERLRTVVDEVISAQQIVASSSEREAIAKGILDEITGLGPLEPLLVDGSVSDVLVNRYDQVWVERGGLLALTDVRFRNEQHLQHTIRRIVAGVGRRVDESSPMVDARLPDGSRINAIVPPLALDGASLSIRRFGSRAITAEDLVRTSTLVPQMLAYLRAAVRAKLSILVAGGTGAGKTTLLNLLSGFIPNGERIITIEDAAELRLQQHHVVRLESRPPNLEGQGEVTIRDLVRNSLRMRPDRIIVGEIRSSEVLDMLQAMNTGHEGSMATVHANSARDAVARLMTMLGLSGVQLSPEIMAQLVARAVHLIVHVTRTREGRRRISSIVEVLGHEGVEVKMQEIFAYQAQGGTGSKPCGRFVRSARTHFVDRFTAAGLTVEGLG